MAHLRLDLHSGEVATLPRTPERRRDGGRSHLLRRRLSRSDEIQRESCFDLVSIKWHESILSSNLA